MRLSKRNALSLTKAQMREKRCPPLTAEQKVTVEKLKKLKSKVELYNQKVREAKTQLEKAAPEQIKENEIKYEKNRRATEELERELQKIEV